jgi:hypothetical protein
VYQSFLEWHHSPGCRGRRVVYLAPKGAASGGRSGNRKPCRTDEVRAGAGCLPADFGGAL